MHIPWTTILPVVTLIIGWALASLTEVWKSQRDSAAKALERREARLLRRNEFQRETLLVLQETSAALLEGISQKLGMVLINSRKAPSTLTIPEDASPEHLKILAEIDLKYLAASSKLALLIVRIRDEEVRRIAFEFCQHCRRAEDVQNWTEALREFDKAVSSSNELNRQIGKVLAELDTLDDQI